MFYPNFTKQILPSCAYSVEVLLHDHKRHRSRVVGKLLPPLFPFIQYLVKF